MNPIDKFKNWYQQETQRSVARIPSACCLSTIGEDNYPNARFVSLKAIKDEKFVVTGPLTSRKGTEISTIPKASLTFWWTETERQVRIQGDCTIIEDELADMYFAGRSIESKIVSTISEQGEYVDDYKDFQHKFENEKVKLKETQIQRPDNWSGIYVIPNRIEFMEFKPDRFHFRELYTYDNGVWIHQLLQP